MSSLALAHRPHSICARSWSLRGGDGASHNGSDPLCVSVCSELGLLEPVCAYGVKSSRCCLSGFPAGYPPFHRAAGAGPPPLLYQEAAGQLSCSELDLLEPCTTLSSLALADCLHPICARSWSLRGDDGVRHIGSDPLCVSRSSELGLLERIKIFVVSRSRFAAL